MMLHTPAVAGRLYDSDALNCAASVARLSAKSSDPFSKLFGGIVPHAGWVCLDPIAGMTFLALGQAFDAKTIVLIGSIHTMQPNPPHKIRIHPKTISWTTLLEGWWAMRA